jgi:hypothetical protein
MKTLDQLKKEVQTAQSLPSKKERQELLGMIWFELVTEVGIQEANKRMEIAGVRS